MTASGQVSLGEILTPATDEVSLKLDETYRVAGIYSFGRGLFEREAILGAETSYKTLARLRTNEFVVSKLNGWEGAVDVVPPELDGCHVSSEYPVFSIDSRRADPGYVRWIARWPAFWDRLIPRGSMVRRKRVQPSQLLEVEIPLPSIGEQLRQASRLDSIGARARDASGLLAKYDSDAILTALPPLVDETARRVSSDRVLLGDLVDLVSDTVHPGNSPGDADCFVGLQHIERHTGRRLGADPLSLMKGRKFRFQPGDVVYGYLRPYLNKVWAADRHGLCSVDQYVLRPKPAINPELVAHILRGQAVLDLAVDLTHSLQLPRLRSGLLMSLDVPLVAEQDAAELVHRLDALRDCVVELAATRDRQTRAASALMPAALNHAFGAR